MALSLALNFLVALLAIVNPLGKIPLWIEAAKGEKPGVKRRLAILVTGTGCIILFVFLYFGKQLLGIFGIDIAAFRIGGGIVILVTGLRMLEGEAVRVDTSGEEGVERDMDAAKIRLRKVVVPLVVPFIAGPGSITTVLLFGARIQSLLGYILLGAVLLSVMGAVLAILFSAERIRRWMGDTSLDVLTRLFGLILAAIAAQLIIEGLGQAFPGWLEGTTPLQDDLNSKSAGG